MSSLGSVCERAAGERRAIHGPKHSWPDFSPETNPKPLLAEDTFASRPALNGGETGHIGRAAVCSGSKSAILSRSLWGTSRDTLRPCGARQPHQRHCGARFPDLCRRADAPEHAGRKGGLMAAMWASALRPESGRRQRRFGVEPAVALFPETGRSWTDAYEPLRRRRSYRDFACVCSEPVLTGSQLRIHVAPPSGRRLRLPAARGPTRSTIG